VSQTRRHHGFALVLVLVLASVSFQVAAPDEDWSQLVTILLGAATLAVSVWAARAPRALARGAAAAGVLLALISVVVLIVWGDVPTALTALVNGMLIAIAPAVIAGGLLRDLREDGGVTLTTLSGVLAIYLLLGMLFSLSVQGPRVKRGVRVDWSGCFVAGWGVRVGEAAVRSVRAGAQPYLGPRPARGRRHDG
jgi:hypothetical protein